MGKVHDKVQRLRRRKYRIRNKIKGTPERPRLTVNRSLNHIYAQIIDDTQGHTLCSVSSLQLKKRGNNIDAAKEVGKALGEKAKEANITKVCFDRNGRIFHGRIKALADGAREAGLEF